MVSSEIEKDWTSLNPSCTDCIQREKGSTGTGKSPKARGIGNSVRAAVRVQQKALREYREARRSGEAADELKRKWARDIEKSGETASLVPFNIGQARDSAWMADTSEQCRDVA